mmetsp:Transcript_19396/g.32561  ORF Transcript_19396/g.32561 Transcript_19396/m.32561 type:complete len:212 (-) Transcript_19396:405-1040(-)
MGTASQASQVANHGRAQGLQGLQGLRGLGLRGHRAQQPPTLPMSGAVHHDGCQGQADGQGQLTEPTELTVRVTTSEAALRRQLHGQPRRSCEISWSEHTKKQMHSTPAAHSMVSGVRFVVVQTTLRKSFTIPGRRCFLNDRCHLRPEVHTGRSSAREGSRRMKSLKQRQLKGRLRWKCLGLWCMRSPAKLRLQCRQSICLLLPLRSLSQMT